MSHRFSQRAFTLIELLTVITIIAILTSILLPVSSSMMARARDTACVNNLRQIGISANAAAADNNNTYPIIEFDSAGQTVSTTLGVTALPLAQALANYGITPKMLICPTDAAQPTPPGPSYLQGYSGGISYMWQPVAEDNSSSAPMLITRRGATNGAMLNQIAIPPSRCQLCSDWTAIHTPSNVISSLGPGKMMYVVYADGHVRNGLRSAWGGHQGAAP